MEPIVQESRMHLGFVRTNQDRALAEAHEWRRGHTDHLPNRSLAGQNEVAWLGP